MCMAQPMRANLGGNPGLLGCTPYNHADSPTVKVSASFCENVAWIENFFAPEDSLARAEFTLVSDDWMVATRVEALDCVEIEAVWVKVTMVPDSASFWADVVRRRVPSEDAKAVICVV